MKKKSYEIIYEDDDIIIVNKAAGLLVIQDRYDKDIPYLQALLAKDHDEVLLVHRIDRDTSGLVIFAKNKVAQRDLNLQFQDKEIDKKYLAIVDGQMNPVNGTIVEAIAESAKKGHYKVDKKGKSAETLYKTSERYKRYSLVEYTLITGRTHQIRVHSAFLGHPIVGDNKYNSSPDFLISKIKKKKFNLKQGEKEQSLIHRQMLHAATLQIIHPTTKEVMNFEAGMPKDMRAVLNQLGKWDKID